MTLIENGHSILWFFLFPLFGLLLKYILPKMTLISLLIISIIVTLPVLFGYSYIMPSLNGILLFATLSIAFSCLISSTQWKLPLIFSSILFIILGIIGFLASMAGTVKPKQKWIFGTYKIELLEERGFSGGPLMVYKLSQYKFNSTFIKELEVYAEYDSIPNCEIQFKSNKLIFDKCKYVLKKNVP